MNGKCPSVLTLVEEALGLVRFEEENWLEVEEALVEIRAALVGSPTPERHQDCEACDGTGQRRRSA